MKEKQQLSSNLEDYLEVISELSNKKGHAHPSDIAESMKVKRPSVTSALNSLSEKGFIDYEKYKPVTLTKEGELVANNITNKHGVLKKFFNEILGVNANEADLVACEMKHSLNDGMTEKLVSFIKSANKCSFCPAKFMCSKDCPQVVSLSTLRKGDKGIVINIDESLKNADSFVGMGLTIGSKIEVIRFAPLGDPVIIKVRSTEISLSKKELNLIKVKRI